MPVKLTATAWLQAWKNGLICGIGMLVVLGAFSAAVSLLPGRTFLGSIWPSLLLLGGVSYLAFLGSWLYGLRARGRVLLDCGPVPLRRYFLMFGVLFVLIALDNGLTATPESTSLLVAKVVFMLANASFWFILATGRFQVCENGLWLRFNLCRWSKIAHYRWAPDSTLMLTGTRRFWLRAAVPVPPELREQFDALLTQHWSPTRGSAA